MSTTTPGPGDPDPLPVHPDPVTRILLREAAAPEVAVGDLDRMLLVDDVDAALTRTLRTAAGAPDGVPPDLPRAWVDDLREARAVEAAGGRVGGPADALHPAPTLVLGRLPTALSALDDLAEQLARRCDPTAQILLGGRVKHMTRAQNNVLARHFTDVSASLGQQKCRVLRATGPRPGDAPRWPRRQVLDDPVLGEPLTLLGRGAVFAEGRLDAGTRLLLQTMAARGPSTGRALDLGSGSGVIAVWLARRGLDVSALDVSAAAVESTRLSAQAAGVAVEVGWADGVAGVPAGSVDVLVSNPPFHRGAAKDSTATLQLIDQAADALSPDGELWLVWNSHLPYLPRLRQRVGPTQVVAQDRSYVVSRSTRR